LNPGFEDNVLSDGSSGPVPTSWSGGGIAWNPTTTSYPSEAPEGQNVAAINAGDLWQTIAGSSITAGLTYRN
jgi:HpiC1 cyclase